MKEATTVALSTEALQDIIRGTVVAAITELRKPTPEEQEKKDKEKALQARRDQEMLALAKEEEDSKKNRQARCGHKKENGKWATGGQIFSDGKAHVICLHCQKESVYTPSADMLNGNSDFAGWPIQVV